MHQNCADFDLLYLSQQGSNTLKVPREILYNERFVANLLVRQAVKELWEDGQHL